MIEDGEVFLSPTNTHVYNWGQRNPATKKHLASYNFKIPGGGKIRAEVTVRKYWIDIPFTVYLSSKVSHQEVTTLGRFTGGITKDVHVTYKPAL